MYYFETTLSVFQDMFKGVIGCKIHFTSYLNINVLKDGGAIQDRGAI